MQTDDLTLLRLLQQTLDHCEDMLIVTDDHGQCVFANQKTPTISKPSLPEPQPENTANQLDPQLQSLTKERRSRRVRLSSQNQNHEFFLRYQQLTARDQAPPYHLFTFERLDLNRNESKHYFAVDGLFSRAGFQHYGGLLLEQEQPLILVVLNIRSFRFINDRYGHRVGDLLIHALARRLDNQLPGHWMSAHLKGAEFAVLAPQDELTNLAGIEAFLNGLIHKPFICEETALKATLRAGIALFPQHSENIGQLLNQAETALTESRDKQRQSIRYFDPGLNRQQTQHIELLDALKSGLADQAFELVYQIQQDARGLDIIGVEALLRFNPEQAELRVGPGAFIPLLEQSGLIVEVGEFVLRKAAEQAVLWQKLTQEQVSVSVNISSIQLHAPCFYRRVQRVIIETGVNPEQIELELTESALVTEPDKAERVLRAVKELGVKLTLDDFGTGYSSLSYLKRFPFDRLKIDQSFVRDLIHDKHDLEIVRAIIAMGKALSLQIIAEGVETAEQRDMLDALGCDLFQGYLIGRPSPALEVEPLLGTRLL